MSRIDRGIGVLRNEGVLALVSETARFLWDATSRVYARRRYTPPAPECEIAQEDWDNLVVLDACRFDQFERLNTLSGRLEARSSLGSATPEFLKRNFEGRTLHDTVYVTANPIHRLQDLEDVFHAVVDVWEFGWDDESKTVTPETMLEATVEAGDAYPDKRLIAHFLQPHYPFVGEGADRVGAHAGMEETHRRVRGEDPVTDDPNVWDLVESGAIDEENVRAAYDGNLKAVLPAVETLVDTLHGLTVVTSDHGNLLGERIAPFSRRMYGHPFVTPVEPLRKVPWLVVEAADRKEVREEPPERTSEREVADPTERLAQLGYAET
jgi:hypothetical protein